MTKLSNAQIAFMEKITKWDSLLVITASKKEIITGNSLAAKGLLVKKVESVRYIRYSIPTAPEAEAEVVTETEVEVANEVASRYVQEESICATLEELQVYGEEHHFNNIDTLVAAYIAVGGIIVTEEVVTEEVVTEEVVTESVEVANEFYIVRKLIMGRDGYPLGILDIEVPTDGGEKIGDDNAHSQDGNVASLVETDDPAATRDAITSDVAAVGGHQTEAGPQAEETVGAAVGQISARADISMTNCISGRFEGTVKVWNEDKGYGYISAEYAPEYGELYFRRENLRRINTPLSVGDTVTFRIWETSTSSQAKAVDILVDGKTPAPRPVNPVTAAAVEKARQSEVRRIEILAQSRAREQARRDARHRALGNQEEK